MMCCKADSYNDRIMMVLKLGLIFSVAVQNLGMYMVDIVLINWEFNVVLKSDTSVFTF